MTYRLPKPEQVSELFTTLVGRSVALKKARPQFLRAGAKVAVATYLPSEGDDVAGVCIFDMPLAVYVSAALSMIPRVTAAEAANSGVLEPNMAENLTEVFNVASQLICSEGDEQARLGDRFLSARELPEALFKRVRSAKNKLHVGLEIDGYGPGVATFLVL